MVGHGGPWWATVGHGGRPHGNLMGIGYTPYSTVPYSGYGVLLIMMYLTHLCLDQMAQQSHLEENIDNLASFYMVVF